MTDDIVRKFVKPAHEGASIPDPHHAQDLPQEGLEVVWDHYWKGREMTGDVIVSDPPFGVQPTPVKDKSPEAPPESAALNTKQPAKA